MAGRSWAGSRPGGERWRECQLTLALQDTNWPSIRTAAHLNRMSSRDLVQGHGSVQLPLVKLPHVHLIELLKVRRHQQTVLWKTHTQPYYLSQQKRTSRASGLQHGFYQFHQRLFFVLFNEQIHHWQVFNNVPRFSLWLCKAQNITNLVQYSQLFKMLKMIISVIFIWGNHIKLLITNSYWGYTENISCSFNVNK